MDYDPDPQGDLDNIVGDDGSQEPVTPDPDPVGDNGTQEPVTPPPDPNTPPDPKSPNYLDWLIKQLTSKIGGTNISGGQLGIAALLAYLGKKYDTRKPTGGGVAQAYAGYTPIQRTMVAGPSAQPGIPGQPIAQYAGIATPPPAAAPVNQLAAGGIVALEDGGFVMTKKAVDGAGGPQGIQQLVPGARPLHGPGTGTSDSIPAQIKSPGGAIPAAVSNGEAYVPPRHVQQAGGPPAMYSLMNRLQKGR